MVYSSLLRRRQLDIANSPLQKGESDDNSNIGKVFSLMGSIRLITRVQITASLLLVEQEDVPPTHITSRCTSLVHEIEPQILKHFSSSILFVIC